VHGGRDQEGMTLARREEEGGTTQRRRRRRVPHGWDTRSRARVRPVVH
jgi:hypothetical protein